MISPVHSSYRRIGRRILIILSMTASFHALAQNDAEVCGSLRNHYGPFDYRTQRGEVLDVVERHHFSPEVEGLIRGQTSNHIGADLAYTLGTFPNHHRALMSMMQFGEKLKSPQPPHAAYSVECYFVRAIRFQPDDTTVRLMYANYLTRNSRVEQARRELEEVSKAAGDNPFTHYNMGLIYFDMKDYENALNRAHKALALGFPKGELRDKLTAVRQWRTPADSPDSKPTGPASN